MIEAGMPVLGRDGERIGYVAHILDDSVPLPPGLAVAMPRRFGLRPRLVTLTSFDVRDVRDGNVILRITRWDARNRCERSAGSAAGALAAATPRFA